MIRRLFPVLLISLLLGGWASHASLAPAPQQQVSEQWCITSWVFDDTSTPPAYYPPDREDAIGWIDLSPKGAFTWLFVGYEGTGHCGDAIRTWDSLETTVSGADRVALINQMGLDVSPSGETVADMLFSLKTTSGDPSGQRFTRPLIPTRGFVYEINLGNRRLSHQASERDPKWVFSLASLQQDYRKLRESWARGEKGPVHRMELWRWTRKYDLPASTFIPDDLPAERPQKPIQDENSRVRTLRHPPLFSMAASASDDFEIDSSADWTEDVGTITVDNGNNGYLEFSSSGSPTGLTHYNTTMDSDDHESEVVIDAICGGGTFCGAATRIAGATPEFYMMIYQGSGTALEIYKYVGGFGLVVQCAASSTHTTADAYKLISDGDQHSCEKNGSPVGSAGTDTDITANTDVGIVSSDTGTNFESWNAVDLGGGGGVQPQRVIFVQ